MHTRIDEGEPSVVTPLTRADIPDLVSQSTNKAAATSKDVSAPGARLAKVCYEWNHNPAPVCPFPGCRYQHICWYCSSDPQVTEKEHKAMHCPQRRRSHPPVQSNQVQPADNYLGYQRFRLY